jgi:hypothetical protein
MSAHTTGCLHRVVLPSNFLVLRVTLVTVKTPVAIMPIAIFGYKFINEMINEDEKAAEMSVQYRVIPIRD